MYLNRQAQDKKCNHHINSEARLGIISRAGSGHARVYYTSYAHAYISRACVYFTRASERKMLYFIMISSASNSGSPNPTKSPHERLSLPTRTRA